MYIVADASVFILGKPLKGEVITVPAVEQELKDIRSRIKLQISDVRIEPPTKETLKRATDAARETGDLSRLSKTDLEVLAKAIEYDAALATDDYALQNVAAHLGLRVEPVVQRGIRRLIKRTQRCPGCGRAFEGDLCPVCGTPPKIRKKG
ncbi:NOB1 family endonuclease [Methanothrix sp.]|uniref:NOB1 family endonuclease n=1 Tax=Methanothrix sp. TaxID=90426 RepID=UPI003C7355BA